MHKQLIALSLLWATQAFAQDAVERSDAANARCEAAREQRLAPIRAQKIAQCKRRAQQPTAGCETYYGTYGNNSNHANGSVVRGRFYDLPACVAARRTGNELLQKQDF